MLLNREISSAAFTAAIVCEYLNGADDNTSRVTENLEKGGREVAR